VRLKSLFLMLAMAGGLCAQFGPPPPPPPAPGKPGAPVKGDAASIPTNAEGRRVLDTWDPVKDEAAGLQCKAYGAPAIMRVPGRLHVTWQDDTTMKIETDAGQQTRLFHFGGQSHSGGAPSWQGYSSAKWEGALATVNPPVAFGLGLGPRLGARSRSLEVTTTQLRAGYLRKNGVPYSDKTVLKEYYDLFSEPNADTWLMVMTVVEDPTYLAIPFVTTSHFKKITDASGWDPQPCTAR
jgi:hypothetical protein